MEEQKITVLHVMPSLGIGGVNRFIIDLCSCLVECTNIELGIYICDKSNNTWENQFKELEGVKLYYGNTKTNYWNISDFLFFRNIAKNYNIIHWHVFNPILMLYSTKLNVKNIFTHHSVYGTLRKYTLKDKIKWNLFKYYVFHYFDFQIFNSLYTFSFWKKHGAVSTHYRIIYNGIILKGDIEDKTINNKVFIVGTSSALIKCKRVDLLIRSFAEFCKNKDNTKLLIVGDGIEKNKLEYISKNLGLSNKVTFTGYQKVVKTYQEKMDICVFPSTTETFGLAAAECLYLGKPTICFSDGGGICEVIGEKSQNIVKDEKELVKRLNFYYGEKMRTGTCFDEEFHERALLFNMNDKCKEYADVYRNLIYGNI